jgi:hypothetical protein
MRFVLLLEASTSPLVPQITPALLAMWADAMTVYLDRDVSAEWGGDFQVRAGASATDIQTGEVAFGLLDALPDAPDAVAYHSVDGNAVPFLVVGLDMCSGVDDLSVAISHELAETAGDEDCNGWRDDGAGAEWAQELCDAVQERSYPIETGAPGLRTMVSDFLLRSFFAPNHVGPYTHMGRAGLVDDLPKPFATASGGYQITRTIGGTETQVTGILGRRTAKAKHRLSRTYRRGVRV